MLHPSHRGTDVDINHVLGIDPHSPEAKGNLREGQRMESNQRYYSRRAVEERMAARRAITEQARDWHSKLAEDFARRAENSGTLSAA